MMMPCPCPSGFRLLKTFFKLKKFVYNGKMTEVIFPSVKVETLKFQQFYLVKLKVSTLTYGKMNSGHFSIINRLIINNVKMTIGIYYITLKYCLYYRTLSFVYQTHQTFYFFPSFLVVESTILLTGRW